MSSLSPRKRGRARTRILQNGSSSIGVGRLSLALENILEGVNQVRWRERAMLRSLANSASNRGLPGSLSARNFIPTPAPCLAWRTMASALISPSCTRKSSRTETPVARGLGVCRNNPPVLKSCTRETSSWPLHCHKTQTSSSTPTRELSRLDGTVPNRTRGLRTFWPLSADGRVP
jgi:hypothetical protein